MRSLRQSVVVLGALALVAVGAGTAGAGTAGAGAAAGERIPASVHALEVSIRLPRA